jgi:TPR repeat protein
MYERGLGVGRSAQLAGMWYSASAGHGDREAPYLHGLMLQSAGGGRRNQEEVARLFRLAAERGHADAQRALGMLYANGEGVARSDPEAAQWLHKSAAQGNDRAKQELARRRW